MNSSPLRNTIIPTSLNTFNLAIEVGIESTGVLPSAIPGSILHREFEPLALKEQNYTGKYNVHFYQSFEINFFPTAGGSEDAFLRPFPLSFSFPFCTIITLL